METQEKKPSLLWATLSLVLPVAMILYGTLVVGVRPPVLPLPGALFTSMRPPWASAICLTIERPRPLPRSAPREASACQKRS